MSRANTGTTAIVTALATINGTGSFSADLSGTGCVQVGTPDPEGGRLPVGWVAFLGSEVSRDADLGGYRTTYTWAAEVRVAADGSSLATRSAQGANLLEDVITVLTAEPTLGGAVLDIEVSGGTVSGDEAGVPGAVLVGVRIEGYHHILQGART